MGSDEQQLLRPAPKWGRVLIQGGTDWPRLGRKDKTTAPQGPDLPNAHILRSLSNVKAVSVHTSHSGCHAIVLDIHGAAYLFGRAALSALGLPATPLVPESAPRKLLPSNLGAPLATKFVGAACGRSHSLLITDDGEVFSAGANNMGQCGHPPQPEISSFQLIVGPWSKGKNKDRVIQAAAGITFSLVLTQAGKVYSFGSAEKGQLGNGKTGEHIGQGNRTIFDIESEPIPVKGLEGKKIVQIACGQQHSVLLDDAGLVYAFGFNGYCRLGLGNQQDVLAPKLVPQFTGGNPTTTAKFIAAGPTNTVIIDQQHMYWMAGKWKTSGDGSSGQPYTSFRYMQDIAACKILFAASGGVTHFATTPDNNGGVMTVGWGQNAYNFELGLGEGQPKSAVKPLQVHPLDGIDVFYIAAGQNTTFLIASPNEPLSELPRHPAEVDSPELCIRCHVDRGESEPVLECEKCEHPYHLDCLTPPLAAVPDGEWFCDVCADEHEPKSAAKPAFAQDESGPTKKRRGTSSVDETATNKKRK